MIQMQLYLVIVLNSIICLGIHTTTREGMVFEPIANAMRCFANGIMDESQYLCKPLFDCMPCMASIWGVAGYFYFEPDINIIVYVLALCGVNALISKIYYYGD